jgi:acetamidase/formamidase
MTFAEREPLRHRYPHGPYSMVGPVEVAGAKPGDVIEFSMLALRIGFADGLDDALTGCLRELIGWLAAATELSESEAYALASMAVSFRVTQYAHQTASAYTSAPPKAVHAVIPKAIFPPGLRDQVQRWLRPGTAAGR